ncbi:hybrid sensor histidine kinase/response regulator [Mariprofundus micogutta]|nr:response regulator [Mariprofundus micogutta]
MMSWLQYRSLTEELPAQIEHEAQQHTEIISESIANNVLYKKSFPLWNQMKKTMERFNSDPLIQMDSFAVVDEHNRVLAHSDTLNHPLLSSLKLGEAQLAWNENTLTVVTPVLHPLNSRYLGSLAISFEASAIEYKLDQARDEFLLFLLLAFVLSSILALGIRQRVAQPLKELKALSSLVGTGGLDSSAFHAKPKELRELADSMQASDDAIVGKSREIKQLATVIEQADELVILTDLDGIIQYVNPTFERISGFSSQEAIGKTPNIVKSGEHDQGYYTRMWDALLEGKAWRDDFKNRRKDGSIYQVTQTIFPIKSDDVIVGFAAVQRDVTQTRLVEEKLHHTDRVESLGVLAGGIAHDFNNLLTAILGNSALALKKLDQTSPAISHIESIEAASHSAADLCRQMLAYSGKGKFIVKPVNLTTLVEQMSKLIEVSIAKSVVMKYQLLEPLPMVDADVAQIQQIVLNLMTNASEAIGENSGIITLATGVMHAESRYLYGSIGDDHLDEGRYVYLEVSDTGCGMDAETQKKIFDPFFTTKFTGRGLGMSAMLGIVKGHKGAMRIYSEKGQGTTIRVLLPESANQKWLEKDDVSTPVLQHSGLALVIDDEESVREVAEAMLEDMGYQVLKACDGIEGLAAYRERCDEIGIVLLDMTMPRMNGEECFRQLRQIDPDVCVLLSSGYNEQEATSRFAGKGLAGFIQKPYTPQQLSEKIDAIKTG